MTYLSRLSKRNIMSNLAIMASKFFAVSVLSPAAGPISPNDSAMSVESSPETRPKTYRKSLAVTLAAIALVFLAASSSARGQTATVNWTDVHQVIDGFGASDAFTTGSMSSSNQAFFFGMGTGQLGLSLLRVAVPDGANAASGNCSSVSTSCVGPVVGDMQAVIANGGRVYASPWSPPAAYTTNGSVDCSEGSGNGALATADYASYATWLANFVQSLKTENGINLYALSVQNEPDQCQSYDSTLWSATNIDTFVAANLGPTFTANSLSTLIFVPEGGSYSATTSLGSTCGTDSSCAQFIGGYNWHDYDASLSGTNTVAADPYPSGWATGKKYWETETSCGSGFGPNFCQSGFNPNMANALDWAAVIDQRIAVDGANAWLYWWLIDANDTDDEGLESNSGTVAQRAYVLGQYSKFVRPGYNRIDATHLPQTGVSVSAYQNTGTNTLAIIATNYTSSPVSQTFNLTNAPTFSTLTPTTTSASLNLAAQANVSVSSNSFTYTLPAQSITTFVGSASAPPPPTNLAGTVAQ
jgi:glucuronoarabinoxylan endo-1,4-beta-xylanase